MAKTIKEKLTARGEDGRVLPINVEAEQLTITAPNMKEIELPIIGTSPLVMLRFGEKARQIMEDTQEAGTTGKSRKKREPKDFDALYEEAKHISTEGWCGIPCATFRHAMIDACSLVDFFKTVGKKTIFVQADGWGRDDGTALVKILKGEPRQIRSPVRNASGVADIRARAMWEPGWEATVRVQFDADRFKSGDIANLLARAGGQCGICEGRPNSKKGNGCGWGLFKLA